MIDSFNWRTRGPTEELPELKAAAEANPRDAKHALALTIARMYHGEAAAQAARVHFEKTIIRKEDPDEVPEFRPELSDGSRIGLLRLLSQAGLAPSNSEARRLVTQQAVSIDGEKVTDPKLEIDLSERAPFLVKVGKRRFARIVW